MMTGYLLLFVVACCSPARADGNGGFCSSSGARTCCCRSYSGSNTFWLLMDCSMNSYEFPIYCTLKQVNKLGGHINKGAKSMPIIFWDYSITDGVGRKISTEDYRNLSKAERALCTVLPFLKSYNVFNIEQTNLSEKKPEKIQPLQQLFTQIGRAHV